MKNNNKHYITGIDGLRSLAVLGVILYHLLPQVMAGGYLGVPLFFVISGYLMTDILNWDWQKNHKIPLSHFYRKRIRRLFPSLISVMLFTCTIFVIWAPKLLHNFRMIFVSALFYVNNWWQIINGQSYFQRLGSLSPYTHLWSLSVEGQFYLLFPIVLGILYYWKCSKKQIRIFLWGGIVISALLMGIIFWGTHDVNRVYYGTDTRLFSLFLGALLATKDIGRVKFNQLSAKWQYTIGMVALLLTFSFLFVVPDYSPFVYSGGMVVFSLLSAVLLLCVLDNQMFNKLLTNPVFTWIGERSYEIYLWQFPVMIFLEEQKIFFFYYWLDLLVKIVIILVLSDLTYRFIGKPFRQKMDIKILLQPALRWIGILLVLTTCVTAYGFITATSGTDPENQELVTTLQKNKAQLNKKAPATKKEKANQKAEKAKKKVKKVPPFTKAEKEQGKDVALSGIGDSLLLNIAPNLQEVFPKSYLDGEIGRQLYDSKKVFEKTAQKHELKENVVIMLGNNGSFTASQLNDILNYLGKKRNVFLVNVRVPRSWEGQVNRLLKRTANTRKNVYLVDWYKKSKNHSEWFYDDQIHTNPDGAQALSRLIAQTVIKHQVKK